MIMRLGTSKDFSTLQKTKSQYELETGGQISNKSIEKFTFWLAEENNQIVSVIFIDIVDNFAELPIVFTLPTFRNQGIATELFTYVITWAKSQNLTYLILWPTQKSQPFYSRLGFRSAPSHSHKKLSPLSLVLSE